MEKIARSEAIRTDSFTSRIGKPETAVGRRDDIHRTTVAATDLHRLDQWQGGGVGILRHQLDRDEDDERTNRTKQLHVHSPQASRSSKGANSFTREKRSAGYLDKDSIRRVDRNGRGRCRASRCPMTSAASAAVASSSGCERASPRPRLRRSCSVFSVELRSGNRL